MVYTVTQINTQIQEMLEEYMPFHNVFIRGEISNYKLHTSGHHYMTLKDENSVISTSGAKAADSLKKRNADHCQRAHWRVSQKRPVSAVYQ